MNNDGFTPKSNDSADATDVDPRRVELCVYPPPASYHSKLNTASHSHLAPAAAHDTAHMAPAAASAAAVSAVMALDSLKSSRSWLCGRRLLTDLAVTATAAPSRASLSAFTSATAATAAMSASSFGPGQLPPPPLLSPTAAAALASAGFGVLSAATHPQRPSVLVAQTAGLALIAFDLATGAVSSLYAPTPAPARHLHDMALRSSSRPRAFERSSVQSQAQHQQHPQQQQQQQQQPRLPASALTQAQTIALLQQQQLQQQQQQQARARDRLLIESFLRSGRPAHSFMLPPPQHRMPLARGDNYRKFSFVSLAGGAAAGSGHSLNGRSGLSVVAFGDDTNWLHFAAVTGSHSALVSAASASALAAASPASSSATDSFNPITNPVDALGEKSADDVHAGLFGVVARLETLDSPNQSTNASNSSFDDLLSSLSTAATAASVKASSLRNGSNPGSGTALTAVASSPFGATGFASSLNATFKPCTNTHSRSVNASGGWGSGGSSAGLSLYAPKQTVFTAPILSRDHPTSTTDNSCNNNVLDCNDTSAAVGDNAKAAGVDGVSCAAAVSLQVEATRLLRAALPRLRAALLLVTALSRARTMDSLASAKSKSSGNGHGQNSSRGAKVAAAAAAAGHGGNGAGLVGEKLLSYLLAKCDHDIGRNKHTNSDVTQVNVSATMPAEALTQAATAAAPLVATALWRSSGGLADDADVALNNTLRLANGKRAQLLSGSNVTLGRVQVGNGGFHRVFTSNNRHRRDGSSGSDDEDDDYDDQRQSNSKSTSTHRSVDGLSDLTDDDDDSSPSTRVLGDVSANGQATLRMFQQRYQQLKQGQQQSARMRQFDTDGNSNSHKVSATSTVSDATVKTDFVSAKTIFMQQQQQFQLEHKEHHQQHQCRPPQPASLPCSNSSTGNVADLRLDTNNSFGGESVNTFSNSAKSAAAAGACYSCRVRTVAAALSLFRENGGGSVLRAVAIALTPYIRAAIYHSSHLGARSKSNDNKSEYGQGGEKPAHNHRLNASSGLTKSELDTKVSPINTGNHKSPKSASPSGGSAASATVKTEAASSSKTSSSTSNSQPKPPHPQRQAQPLPKQSRLDMFFTRPASATTASVSAAVSAGDSEDNEVKLATPSAPTSADKETAAVAASPVAAASVEDGNEYSSGDDDTHGNTACVSDSESDSGSGSEFELKLEDDRDDDSQSSSRARSISGTNTGFTSVSLGTATVSTSTLNALALEAASLLFLRTLPVSAPFAPRSSIGSPATATETFYYNCSLCGQCCALHSSDDAHAASKIVETINTPADGIDVSTYDSDLALATLKRDAIALSATQIVHERKRDRAADCVCDDSAGFVSGQSFVPKPGGYSPRSAASASHSDAGPPRALPQLSVTPLHSVKVGGPGLVLAQSVSHLNSMAANNIIFTANDGTDAAAGALGVGASVAAGSTAATGAGAGAGVVTGEALPAARATASCGPGWDFRAPLPSAAARLAAARAAPAPVAAAAAALVARQEVVAVTAVAQCRRTGAIVVGMANGTVRVLRRTGALIDVEKQFMAAAEHM